eukprot:TRINITY_DN28645_c0_g1_i14.p1 TRINITY_DN28645_c0_g1~~TRINITY_DN28645_c0_g1_i14.p1  ORF type:complete len:108 (+),score=2.93 TRINITY_DN28645_c0_g1_i14:15-338(+)
MQQIKGAKHLCVLGIVYDILKPAFPKGAQRLCVFCILYHILKPAFPEEEEACYAATKRCTTSVCFLYSVSYFKACVPETSVCFVYCVQLGYWVVPLSYRGSKSSCFH